MINNTSGTLAIAIEGLLAMVMAVVLVGTPGLAQTSTQPFPTPIPATDRVGKANFIESASLPDIGGQPMQPLLLCDTPFTMCVVVDDIQGPSYRIRYAAPTVM